MFFIRLYYGYDSKNLRSWKVTLFGLDETDLGNQVKSTFLQAFPEFIRNEGQWTGYEAQVNGASNLNFPPIGYVTKMVDLLPHKIVSSNAFKSDPSNPRQTEFHWNLNTQ